MKKFESIKVGQTAVLKHTIIQADIDRFVELTGDDNKIHVDKDFAGKTSYKKPVAHGMLGASFISTIIGTKLPGDGALWYAQNLEFLLPVRVGDVLTIRARVVKKSERGRTIELATDIFNQNGRKVTAGTAKVRVVEERAAPCARTGRRKGPLVALVLGGTGGIGRETCIQLAKDGYDIAIHYHGNAALAKRLTERISKMGGKTLAVQADIDDMEQVKALVGRVVRRLKTITVVVNCTAAGIPNVRLRDMEWDVVQKQINIQVRGAFNIQQCVFPIMEKNRYGKIIHIATQAVDQPNPEWLHYITAKAALVGLAKASAVEMAPKGIRVNLVSPGMVDTKLIADVSEKARLLTEAQTPLRSIARPEDVAGVISFLASSKSDFLAGETIRVNGGQVML